MNRLQFSMVGLMFLVGFCAISFAALSSASSAWANALFTFILLFLLISICAAVYKVGTERAFWIGFVVVSWGHWLVGYGPSYQHAGANLVSAWLTQSVHPKLRQVQQNISHIAPPGMAGAPGTVITSTIVGPSTDQVFVVCHSWLTLLFGIAGGLCSRYLAVTRHRAPAH